MIHLETHESTEAYTFNISYGGLGMYLLKPIAEKTRVRIGIPFTDPTGKPLEEIVVGTVRWVKPFKNFYGCGIEFEELSRKDQPITFNFIQEAERLSP